MPLFHRIYQHSHSVSALVRVSLCVLLAGLLSQCTSNPKGDLVVSVKDQKLGIYNEGKLTKQYVISTSKFGLGDKAGSYRTPLGKHEIIAKIGKGLPAGAVLKSRRWNGEVLKPNAPGRDPIVSRILWLRGTESSNKNAFNRYIYIHGTTEECRLGTPASYGCVRMGMKDVVDLFDSVGIGAKVVITKEHLPRGVVDKPVKAAVEAAGDPAAIAQPIEIAKLTPTAGEVQRAAENEAKEKAKTAPEKPAPAMEEPKTKAKTEAGTKIADKVPAKSKAKA